MSPSTADHLSRPGGPRSPLNIGPMYVEDAVDPTDVDARGDIAASASLGSAPDILLLMELNTAAYADLRPKLILRRDEDRTTALEDDAADEEGGQGLLDLVNDALDPPDGRVISASVRGTTQRDRIFTVIVEHESGRMRKDYLPYGDVPEVEAAYQAWKARNQPGGAQFVVPTDDEVSRQLGQLLDEVKSLRERTEKAEERAQAAEERAADPPPWADYDGANIQQVKDQLAALNDYATREGLKARIRDYEPRHENRRGVLDLAKAEDPPPPPPAE